MRSVVLLWPCGLTGRCTATAGAPSRSASGDVCFSPSRSDTNHCYPHYHCRLDEFLFLGLQAAATSMVQLVCRNRSRLVRHCEIFFMKKAKRPLTLCVFCRCQVRVIESHLQKCARRKEIEYLRHLSRLKRIGGHSRRAAPSRASSKLKAQTVSAWKTFIRGGAVETNRRHH